MRYDPERAKVTLEISNPLAACGHCRFRSELSGRWSVEDGRLVFRADADPLTRRGPDLGGCCESTPAIRFEHITVDDEELSAGHVAALRESARTAES